MDWRKYGECEGQLSFADLLAEEEPKEPQAEPEEKQTEPMDYEWHSIETPPPDGTYCMFEYTWDRYQKNDSKGECEGWWKNGRVEWKNMPMDIGRKTITQWIAMPEDLEPLFSRVICEHDRNYLCDRWHDADTTECKADLPKSFACAGCCWNCTQAPMHGGKCKFDCRRKK